MPRGEKSAYTDKQKRQAEHIEESYEERGTPEDEAERRAWATVNKMTGGGKRSGSGRKKSTNVSAAPRDGDKSHKQSQASSTRSTARKTSASSSRPKAKPRTAASGQSSARSRAAK